MTEEHDRSAQPPTAAHADSGGEIVAEVRDASYVYRARRLGETRRIGPLTLTIRRGERVAIIGPNGCGKSTLINLLSAASTPAAGTVRWFGGASTVAARRRIGVVFQAPSLDALLTVRETLRLAGRLLHMTTEAIDRRTAELAGRLGLHDRIDSRVASLSGGLARRVDLARAVLHQPELLLLDEPTAGLDDESAAAFNAMLGTLAQEGVAVVAATHTFNEVRLAHRLIAMHQGRIAIDGPPAGPAARDGTIALEISSDAPDMRRMLDELDAIQTGDSTWQIQTAATPDAGLARVLRAAAEQQVQITTAGTSMDGYFRAAQQAAAAPLTDNGEQS